MTVTDPKIRAKIDSLYWDSKRWKKYFLESYEFVVGKNVSPWGQLSVCTRAADALIGGKEGNASEWMQLDPKARETLRTNLKNDNEKRLGR